MADLTLNRFLARGTNAQRLAFTPDPPTPASGPSPTYLWYETDTGNTYAWDGSAWDQVNSAGSVVVRTIGIVIDGGGSAITTGVKGFVQVPFAGTITRAAVFSIDASATAGDIVVDIWKDTYANYPPTNADSITASAPPTLSAANKAEDTTLTGWTTNVSVGDVFGFNVDSVATVTRVLVLLEVTP